MVRAVLLEVCGPQEVHHRIGWEADKHNIVLNVDNGRIRSRNPIWFQKMLTALLHMFEKVDPQKNLGKTM